MSSTVDFDQTIRLPSRAPGEPGLVIPLGRFVHDVINAYGASERLTLAETVEFGSFAVLALDGGERELPRNRKLLAKMVGRAVPSVAVQALNALGLIAIAEEMTE